MHEEEKNPVRLEYERGLRRGGEANPGAAEEIHIPDYVMIDFGFADQLTLDYGFAEESPSRGTSSDYPR